MQADEEAERAMIEDEIENGARPAQHSHLVRPSGAADSAYRAAVYQKHQHQHQLPHLQQQRQYQQQQKGLPQEYLRQPHRQPPQQQQQQQQQKALHEQHRQQQQQQCPQTSQQQESQQQQRASHQEPQRQLQQQQGEQQGPRQTKSSSKDVPGTTQKKAYSQTVQRLPEDEDSLIASAEQAWREEQEASVEVTSGWSARMSALRMRNAG